MDTRKITLCCLILTTMRSHFSIMSLFLATLCAFTGPLALGQTGYDRKAAVAYAQEWCQDGKYNPDYPKYDADCANFVSQCLLEGGLPLKDCTDRDIRDAMHAQTGVIYRCTLLDKYLLEWVGATRETYESPLLGQAEYPKGVPSWFAPGDIVILAKEDHRYQHAMIAVGRSAENDTICAAHTIHECEALLSNYYRTWKYCHFYRMPSSGSGTMIVPYDFSVYQHLHKSVPDEEKTQVTKDRFTKVANVSCDELSRLGTATAGVLRKELNSPKMRRLAVMRSLTLAEEAKIVGDLFKGFGGWVTKKYAQWGLVGAKPPEDVVTLSTDDELVIFALSTTASDLASVFFGPVGAAGTAVLSEAAKRVGLLIGKTPINGIGYAELGRPGIGTMVIVYDKNQQVAWVTIDLDDLEGQAKENYGWQNEHLYVYIPFNGQPPRLKMTSGKFDYKVVLKGEPVASQTGVTSDQQISIQNLLQKSVEKPATVAEKTGVVGEPETVTPGLLSPSTLSAFATALVIDKSGSMSGEKIKKAKESAYCYVDTCAQNEDVVSLVAFESRAESLTDPVSIAEGRKKLNQDILSVSAGGSTNIGSGLTIAHRHLSSCNSTSKVAVLMTDGQHNTGTYKPEVGEFIKSDWPIYTVGFGKNADMQTLCWIAHETGGLCWEGEIPDLQGIYTRIKVQAHNGSVDRGYTDFIRPGQTLAYDMPVNPGSKKAGCYVHWQGSRMETTLTSPRGQVLNRNNFHQWGRFSEEQTYTFFEIDNPQPGNWQVQIVGHDLPPQGEQVNFQSFSYSDVFSNILSFQPAYSNNQQVRVAVKLAEVIDGKLRPMKGAYVNAEIKKPSVHLKNLILGRRTVNLMDIITTISNQTREIELFDDGQHGDVNPGDGIYANTYNDTATNGPYVVSVYVEGHSRGRRFDRIIEESFQVGNIEQNSFTISDFLGLINKQATGSQIQQPKPKRIQEPKTEEVMKSLLDQLLKK